MKCFFCESGQVVVAGSAFLESTCLFHDILECLECGAVMVIAPKQVIVQNVVTMTSDSVSYQHAGKQVRLSLASVKNKEVSE